MRLEMQRLNKQRFRLAISLEVDAGDEPVVEQEGEDVITVRPLGGGGVDLDTVTKAEQPFGARTLPHQRIEWREQRPAADPSRPGGVAMEIGATPAVDRDRDQHAILDQLAHRL